MFRVHVMMTGFLALTVGAGLSWGQSPVGTRFTYQGQLKLDGQPANGTYDFEFRLYRTDTEISPQIGPTVNVEDVEVVNGLFDVELDFGATAFNGDARWMNVGVRPGDSTDFHQPLSPRQRLSAHPYAAHALSTAQWTNAGSAMMNANDGFVGINRTSRVSGAEYFGIQAPVGDGDYGGMYIRTDGEGWPFYGYSTPAGNAWTYLDGQTSRWHVYNSGVHLTVEDTGQVGIGTQSPIARLHVDGGARFTGTSSVIIDGPHSGTNRSLSVYKLGTGDAINCWNDNASGNAGVFRARGGNAVDAEIIAGAGGTAVNALTNGTGRAGRFEVDNANNNLSGLFATHSGSGNAFAATNTGTGRAGFFQVSNSASDASALFCATNGDGLSFHATGGSDASHSGGGVAAFGNLGGGNIVIDGNEIMARNNGGVSTLFLNHDGGDVHVAQNGTGRLVANVVQITGADLAEKFPVSENVEPGIVVAIDPENPGKLRVSRAAYNRRVAGVVSGAGDLTAGTILGNMPGLEDAPPIALSGRVWVYCDASENGIEPGDLLTTATRAGHAMKVTDYGRAQGATIGKAMTALEQGETGLVLTLVNLH